jgi:hypothetical protein
MSSQVTKDLIKLAIRIAINKLTLDEVTRETFLTKYKEHEVESSNIKTMDDFIKDLAKHIPINDIITLRTTQKFKIAYNGL